MPITKEQVVHAARLAGLKLTPEEQEQFSRELSRIIDYMDTISEINTDGVDVGSVTAAPGPMYRDDAAGESLPVEDVLRNAPEKRDTYFVVPRVI